VCLLLANNHAKQQDTKGTYLGSKKCVPNEDLSLKTSFSHITIITNNDQHHECDGPVCQFSCKTDKNWSRTTNSAANMNQREYQVSGFVPFDVRTTLRSNTLSPCLTNSVLFWRGLYWCVCCIKHKRNTSNITILDPLPSYCHCCQIKTLDDKITEFVRHILQYTLITRDPPECIQNDRYGANRTPSITNDQQPPPSNKSNLKKRSTPPSCFGQEVDPENIQQII
jgi:hypothetical protein